MRRSLLILAAISFSAWSQPAQQQAQPPIVVQVQMPPTNPWMHLVELVVPGIIGAGLALFGVWLTNKNNAATNAANRGHAAKMRDWETKQTAKREHYEALITEFFGLQQAARKLETETKLPPPERKELLESFLKHNESFLQRLNISYLFIPEAIIDGVSSAYDAFNKAYWVPENADAVFTFNSTQKESFSHEFTKLVVAARKDLGYED
jgi:hypothetical protein